MGWLRKRFGEKSTYIGVGVVGSVLTALAGPESVANASPLAVLILGLLSVVSSEKSAK